MRSLLKENLSSIKSFDRNKDSKIDEGELGEAVDTVLAWAKLAKDKEGGWIHYGKDGSSAPTDWSEIENTFGRHDNVFISRKESRHWLPAKIVFSCLGDKK